MFLRTFGAIISVLKKSKMCFTLSCRTLRTTKWSSNLWLCSKPPWEALTEQKSPLSSDDITIEDCRINRTTLSYGQKNALNCFQLDDWLNRTDREIETVVVAIGFVCYNEKNCSDYFSNFRKSRCSDEPGFKISWWKIAGNSPLSSIYTRWFQSLYWTFFWGRSCFLLSWAR